jgi:sulfate transport system permease protein
MSAAVSEGRRPATPSTTEPAWVRRSLIALALVFLTLFLFVPSPRCSSRR